MKERTIYILDYHFRGFTSKRRTQYYSSRKLACDACWELTELSSGGKVDLSIAKQQLNWFLEGRKKKVGFSVYNGLATSDFNLRTETLICEDD